MTIVSIVECHPRRPNGKTLVNQNVGYLRTQHHKFTQVVEKKKRYWPRGGGDDDLRDNAMKNAQKLIKQAADSAELLVQARKQTELIITSFFDKLDWKVVVEWKTDK